MRSGMGPQMCCNYNTEKGVVNGEIGPVSAGAASWCPNAQGGPATYAKPNDTMYAPEARFQPHVVLTHVQKFDVAPRSAQPVLIKIKSTRQTAAGNHSVSVTVADADGHSQTVAVHVTVWDFALPEGWHFPSLWGVWSGGPKDLWSNISSSHTNVSAFEMDLVDLLLEHRIPATSLYGHSLTDGAAGDFPTLRRMGVDGLKMLWDRGQRTYNLMCVDSSFYPNKLPCAKRFPFPSAFATNDVVVTRRNQTVTKQLIGGILEARNLSDAAGWPRNLTTICKESVRCFLDSWRFPSR